MAKNVYVSSVAYAAVTAWSAGMTGDSTANGGRGTYVRATAPTAGNERVFRCTVSGTAGGTEPTWILTKNGTTADGATLVWTECTGQEEDQVAGTLKAPHAKLGPALATGWTEAGDTILLTDNHTESSNSPTYTIPASATAVTRLIAILASVPHIPPTSADLATTGRAELLAATGALLIGVSGGGSAVGVAYMYGFRIAAAQSIGVSQWRGKAIFEKCKFDLTAGYTVAVGNNLQSNTVFKNVTVKFATNSSVSIAGGELYWNNDSGVPVIDSGGIIPTSQLISFGGTGSLNTVTLEGLDLSGMGSGKTIVHPGTSAVVLRSLIKDCKLGASVSITGTIANPWGRAVVSRSDSTNTNYRSELYSMYGTHVTEAVIVRSGGASDGTTTVSRKITTSANCFWHVPFELLPLAVWNEVDGGGTVHVTVEGLVDPRLQTTVPTNDQFWIDVEYLGTASYPLGVVASGTKANTLATGQSGSTGQPQASTASWDSQIGTLSAPNGGTRANGVAYNLGAPIKLATNPGQVWICTTAGTTAGSQPAEYTGAADGASVTDGSATFKAAVRFKQQLTLTPQHKGYIYIYPKVGITSVSSPIYLDPKPILT